MVTVDWITRLGSILVVRQHDNDPASSLLLLTHKGDEAIDVYGLHWKALSCRWLTRNPWQSRFTVLF